MLEIFLDILEEYLFHFLHFKYLSGYSHTKNIKKYCIRLFLFALISQIPFMLLFETKSLNIFFTLLFGLFSIILWDKLKNKKISFIFVFMLAFIAECLSFDYGAFGVLSIFVFYIFREKHILMALSFILLTILNFLPSLIAANFYYVNILYILFTILPLIFILSFNGKKGKDMKYFMYAFYPLHITILYLIKILT